jgi:arginine exporter protein ArgO
MERTQTMGAVLMAVSGLQMLIFTIGVLRKSYLALALPVLAALAAVSGVLFWIGYTMVNMEAELTELDIEDEDETQSFSA